MSAIHSPTPSEKNSQDLDKHDSLQSLQQDKIALERMNRELDRKVREFHRVILTRTALLHSLIDETPGVSPRDILHQCLGEISALAELPEYTLFLHEEGKIIPEGATPPGWASELWAKVEEKNDMVVEGPLAGFPLFYRQKKQGVFCCKMKHPPALPSVLSDPTSIHPFMELLPILSLIIHRDQSERNLPQLLSRVDLYLQKLGQHDSGPAINGERRKDA